MLNPRFVFLTGHLFEADAEELVEPSSMYDDMRRILFTAIFDCLKPVMLIILGYRKFYFMIDILEDNFNVHTEPNAHLPFEQLFSYKFI
mmetsp:Transcript_38854/g.44355  ORF Transcript_38854/g.44355 Transcript_38854/m.44355 type:complete len:89 (+) Transcript_38854:1302-1568(+)